MSNEFVADFIQKCITNGINNPASIRKLAEKHIKDYEAEIRTLSQKIESFKKEQNNFRIVVKSLGGGGTASRKSREPVMDFSTPEENLDPKFKNLCAKICNYVESSNGVSASTIIHDLISLEENKIGYSAIKWLATRKIISRKEDRLLIVGENWQNRPQYDESN